MTQNTIAFFSVLTGLIMLVPPALFAENRFAVDIHKWLPLAKNRNRFIVSNGIAAVSMVIIASITLLFEKTGSISGAMFLTSVMAFASLIAVVQADSPSKVNLVTYLVFTPLYFILGVGQLSTQGFSFVSDTPWVLAAALSSLFLGCALGSYLTETDEEEKTTLRNAIFAFCAVWMLGIGAYVAFVSLAPGLLIIGLAIAATGAHQFTNKDPWAGITIAISLAILWLSAVGFAINML